MIGGRFGTASGVALIAAAGLLSGSMAAQAADLGGNCCADLEERVAELEATTVRKGNRKVSVELSGHVNEAVVFWDDGIESGARVVTSNYSRTRFRFKGSAQINADWSAGFLIEIGLRQTGDSGAYDQETNVSKGPDIRHQALWMKSKSLGTVWLGHTSDATEGMHDICLGCPITSTTESQLGWGGLIVGVDGFYANFGEDAITLAGLGIGQAGHYGVRRNVLKYVSPTFAGFSFSAAWGDADDGVADESTYPYAESHGYDWDVALRYAGEFNSIRVAAGVGYKEVSRRGDDGVFGYYDGNYSSWVGVASIQHVPTGLYVQGNYREQEIIGCESYPGVNCDDKAWGVQVGIAQKWSTLGKTTFWVQYAEHDNGFRSFNLFDSNAGDPDVAVFGTDAQIISLGVNQKIDAAAMELYLTYWNIQADVTGTCYDCVGSYGFDLEDVNVVMAGARIKF